MLSRYALVLAGVIAGVLRGQDPSSAAWFQARYPDLQRVDVQTVVEDAKLAGVTAGSAAMLAVKRQFHAQRGKDRRAEPQFRRVDFPGIDIQPPAIGVDAAAEHENNDGWQYADRMMGEVFAAGECAGLNDVDSWQFESVGGFYSIAVTGSGLAPIADSLLYVRNHKGDPVAFNDNAGTSLLSQVHVYLPAGTYYADVAGYNGTGGGGYELMVDHDPVQIVDLNAAPQATALTQVPLGGVAHDVFRFDLVGDSQVDFVVDSLGNDTMLVLQRGDGVIVFSNDDSFAGVFDAALDVDLPAGTYYVYVSDVDGIGGVSFDVSYAATPVTLPDIVSLGNMTGVLWGDESLRMARIDLTAGPQHVDLMTSDGPFDPVMDTVLTLFDRDLDYLLDVDDDDPFGTFDPTRGNYSRIAMSLPAGVYYAAVAPYTFAFGDVTLTATTNTYFPDGAATFGPFTGNMLGFGDVSTYLLENYSQVSTRVTGDDFYFGLMDENGELMSCTKCAPQQPQAGEFQRGVGTMFFWDRYDFSALVPVNLQPALYMDAEVTSRSKEGDLVFLFAAFGLPTPGFNFGVGDRGMLCLPMGVYLVTFDVQTAPPGGVLTWPGLPTGTNGYLQLQLGDAHTAAGWNGGIPAPATWRNVLSR